MTDCLNCHKIFSGKCKDCPAYQAELAQWKRKIDEHVHNIIIQAWRLQGCSNQPETRTWAVSDVFSTTLYFETTQAGILSYPEKTASIPACKLAPMIVPNRLSEIKQLYVTQLTNHCCGKYPQGASDYSGSARGRYPLRSSSDLDSILGESIPATSLTSLQGLLDYKGAGAFLPYELPTTFISCANFNYFHMGCNQFNPQLPLHCSHGSLVRATVLPPINKKENEVRFPAGRKNAVLLEKKPLDSHPHCVSLSGGICWSIFDQHLQSCIMYCTHDVLSFGISTNGYGKWLESPERCHAKNSRGYNCSHNLQKDSMLFVRDLKQERIDTRGADCDNMDVHRCVFAICRAHYTRSALQSFEAS